MSWFKPGQLAWVLMAGMFCLSCQPHKQQLARTHELFAVLWAEDTCGVSGNRELIGNLIFEGSRKTPYLRNLAQVVSLLGAPDTIFNYSDGMKYFYVTRGTLLCMKFYPDGVYKSLTVFIDPKTKRVISILGGFH